MSLDEVYSPDFNKRIKVCRPKRLTFLILSSRSWTVAGCNCSGAGPHCTRFFGEMICPCRPNLGSF